MPDNPLKGVVLVVLDGFGIAPASAGNAISLAATTNLPGLERDYPHTHLLASGEAVGLPAQEVGSTEVGHIHLGAGRIIYQSLPRINMSIADGTFYTNKAFLEAIEHTIKNKSKLHLIGLLGNGIVHASTEHLHALLNLCKEQKLSQVYVHVITDGRDSPPKASEVYVNALQEKMQQLELGTIASIMGRFYAMDRDLRWERVERTYRCLTLGEGEKATTPQEAIKNSYTRQAYDEFIKPTNIIKDGRPIALIESGDAVIFYNYRIDRPRELTRAFVLEDFERGANVIAYDPYATKYYQKHERVGKIITKPFDRGSKIKDLAFVTMTEYQKELPVTVAFPPPQISLSLSEVLSNNHMSQLKIAESEKERFVTFYFNGLHENAFEGEETLIEPSPKVATYDLKPEMSSELITRVCTEAIKKKKYAFILINYANTDMVGHTGNLKAAVKAVEAVDKQVPQIIEEALKNHYCVLITGDHGNVEEMIDPKSGNPSTEHTDNPVPFIAVSQDLKGRPVTLQPGILADVTVTILSLLGIAKPDNMTGRNLLEEVE